MKYNLISARCYQKVSKFAQNFLKFPEAYLIKGENSLLNLPTEIEKAGCKDLFIMASSHVSKSPEFLALTESLKEKNIAFITLSDVKPNPTIKSVETYSRLFCDGKYRMILAIGGGSVIDTAKLVAALSATPKNTLKGMHGYLKVKGKLPPIIAVPTTAGSGSETTVCAVVTDSETFDKYSINSPKLMPKITVLDPNLFKTLPKDITAQTGMDALTHAIEAFIGFGGTKETDENAIKAVKLIFESLYSAFENGENLEARENMALGSFYAGKAFTKAYVGYVHAIAHSLGGKYNIPHGFANAVILPYVLEEYGDKVYDKLSELAIAINLGSVNETPKALSYKFISAIKNLNKKMNIPTSVQELRAKDIEELCKHVDKEVIPYYPVPKFFSFDELKSIFKKLM